jgi:D-lyxose ketol-isomerase
MFYSGKGEYFSKGRALFRVRFTDSKYSSEVYCAKKIPNNPNQTTPWTY